MGIFDMFRKDPGSRAYHRHSQANRMNDMGKIAEAEKLYMEAMALYLEAESKGCDSARILTGYSVLLMREADYRKAMEVLEKILKLPGLTGEDAYLLYIDRAVCRWKLGDIDLAIEEMEECGEQRKIGLFYNVLGAMLVEKATHTGDFTRAAEFVAEALDYDEDDIISIDNMGWLKYYTGDKPAACAEFKKALAKNQRYSPALAGLALIAFEEGDSAAARDYIARALSVHFPTTSPVTRKWAEDLQKKIG